jgi:NitT/TauT family transport system ATP-binding protein
MEVSNQTHGESKQSAIRLRSVSKVFEYKGSRIEALAPTDLEIETGSFVSLVGPSGCGKTTLMQLCGGFSEPSSGTLEIYGKTLDGPLTDLGIVFQKDVLFDWKTVIENVMLQAVIRGLPLDQYRARAMELLASVGLAGFEDSYPWQLSGGMRQRVALCRAMVHDANLLMFDEPFGALDSLTRDQILLDLQKVWSSKKRTALFITHDIAEAVLLSDRVLVISPRPGGIA